MPDPARTDRAVTARIAEIRAALNRAAVDRSDLDPKCDSWILAALDLNDALLEQRERSFQTARAMGQFCRRQRDKATAAYADSIGAYQRVRELEAVDGENKQRIAELEAELDVARRQRDYAVEANRNLLDSLARMEAECEQYHASDSAS